MSSEPDSFRLSRRRALIYLSGLIAVPFVIRNAGVLMPVRNRLVCTETELERQAWLGTRDWKAYPPTMKDVQAWRASMTRNVERGRMISWTGEGWLHIHRMSEAEKRYKALGLL